MNHPGSDVTYLPKTVLVTNLRGGPPWSGANRALVNIAAAFSLFSKVTLAWKGGITLADSYLVRFPNLTLKSLDSRAVLSSELQKAEVLLTDDDIMNAKAAVAAKKSTKIRTITYCQILYGSHSLFSSFDYRTLSARKRLEYLALRLLPFSMFARRYRGWIQRSDYVIANSIFTSTLLRLLYSLEPSAIVYPPVDTGVFRPRAHDTTNEVVLYGGGEGGDTSLVVLRRLSRVLTQAGAAVVYIGNQRLAEWIAKSPVSSQNAHLSDETLSHIYSRSMFVVCPQTWEMFGYVAAEAIACGAQVLALRVCAFPEFIPPNGYLAESTNDLVSRAETLARNESMRKIDYENEIKVPFSIEQCSAELIRLFQRSRTILRKNNLT